MVSKFMAIDNIKNKCDAVSEQNVKQNLIIKELESKTNEAEDDVSNLKCVIESFRMNFDMLKMKCSTNAEDISDIEE